MPPTVSLIIPMRNEARLIGSLLRDVAAQDFGQPFEVVIADGRSSDGSVEVAERESRRLGLNTIVVDNPQERTATGLNACIRRASGELLVRLDCHARPEPDYVSACVRASTETGADNVGGPTLVEGRSPGERAVAAAMDSPFGGIGWSTHQPEGPVEHDTVYCGAFRADVFRRIGGFDETLGSNEDDELNARLRAAGGRVVLDPRIRLWYTPRETALGVFRQYYRYGLWKPAVMRRHGAVFGVRSLVPPLFALSLPALGLLALVWRPAVLVLAFELVVYLGAAVGAGIHSLRRRRESLRLLPRVLAAFPAFHLGYGLGMLRGALSPREPGRQRPATVRDRHA